MRKSKSPLILLIGFLLIYASSKIDADKLFELNQRFFGNKSEVIAAEQIVSSELKQVKETSVYYDMHLEQESYEPIEEYVYHEETTSDDYEQIIDESIYHDEIEMQYVINTSTSVFHTLTCRKIEEMNADNVMFSFMDSDYLISEGYQPCGICNP